MCNFASRSWGDEDGVGEEERITVSGSMGSTSLKRRRRLRAGDWGEYSAVDVGCFGSTPAALKSSSSAASCALSSPLSEVPSSISSLACTGNRGLGRGIPGDDDGGAADEW